MHLPHMFDEQQLFPFHTNGRKAALANESSVALTINTGNSGRLQIRFENGKTFCRIVLFSEGSERVVEEENEFTPLELATAFDASRNESASFDGFSRECFADFAVPERFMRKGDRLNILVTHPQDRKQHPIFSILLSPDISERVRRFLLWTDSQRAAA